MESIKYYNHLIIKIQNVKLFQTLFNSIIIIYQPQTAFNEFNIVKNLPKVQGQKRPHWLYLQQVHSNRDKFELQNLIPPTQTV